MYKYFINRMYWCKALLFFFSFSVVSCSSDLPEEEQYAELKEGLKYRTYKKMSQGTLPVVLSQYNANVDESVKVDEYDIHMMLGILWGVSLKPDFALAECNIAKEQASEKNNQERLKSIMAIAMYEKGWTGMGKTTSEEARAVGSERGSINNIEQFGYDLSLGLLAIQEGDLGLAKDTFSRLEAVTGVTYLTQLADAGATIQHGEFQNGIDKFKAIADDPTLPDVEKGYIDKLVKSLEEKYDEATSPTFLLNQVSNTVFEVIGEQRDKEFGKLINQLKQFADGVGL